MGFIAPPSNASLDTHPTVNLVISIVLAVEVLGAVGYAASKARKSRSLLPLVLVVGGALGGLGEPFCSVIGHVQYPDSHQVWVAITVFGTSIPVWIILSYALMLGMGSFVLLTMLENGGGGRAVMRVWGTLIVSDLIFQYLLLGLHAFRYYGPNAFDVFGLPLWWLPLDSSLGIIPALVVYAVGRERWQWRHTVALLALYPAAQLVNYIVPGWPTWIVSNTVHPGAWLWVATTLTLGLSVIAIRLLAALADQVPRFREHAVEPRGLGPQLDLRAAASVA